MNELGIEINPQCTDCPNVRAYLEALEVLEDQIQRHGDTTTAPYRIDDLKNRLIDALFENQDKLTDEEKEEVLGVIDEGTELRDHAVDVMDTIAPAILPTIELADSMREQISEGQEGCTGPVKKKNLISRRQKLACDSPDAFFGSKYSGKIAKNIIKLADNI